MRALGVIMTAVAVLLSAPADGAAQTDLSGTWTLTVQSDQGGELLADIKGIWRTWELPEGLRSWTL